jgi:hypothetical protein
MTMVRIFLSKAKKIRPYARTEEVSYANLYVYAHKVCSDTPGSPAGALRTESHSYAE